MKSNANGSSKSNFGLSTSGSILHDAFDDFLVVFQLIWAYPHLPKYFYMVLCLILIMPIKELEIIFGLKVTLSKRALNNVNIISWNYLLSGKICCTSDSKYKRVGEL